MCAILPAPGGGSIDLQANTGKVEAGQGVTGGSQCRKKSPSLVLPEQSAGVSPQRFDRVTLRIASWAGTGSALWMNSVAATNLVATL
jgi:hypothetical protein